MGLVVINADDWGRAPGATEAILECFLAGRITTTTAMVFMDDSGRAAGRANDAGVPVGLHINLTEPYTAADVPASIRERQRSVARFFSSHRLARWFYNPLLRRSVRASIEDQINEFRVLYGRDPSHVDGHHHIHICPNVLLASAIPPGWKMRRSFTFLPHEKPLLNRAWRSGFNAYVKRRYPGTDYFCDLNDLELDAGELGVPQRLALAEGASIEVMCHPEWKSDFDILMSEHWADVLERLPTSDYAAIADA